jgi:hypothetical protein
VWWNTDNFVLNVAQALAVALPAAGLPLWLEKARRGAWALILPASIIVAVTVISLVPASADVYTWLALLGVPVGCALALGWAAHGARWPLALLAVPLLAVAWAWQDTRAGELARDALILGSCVTLGRLIAGAAPQPVVKVALVAMAVVDAILVFSGELEAPNAVLNAAVPAPGLPQLQTGVFGASSLGYGDFLAAGVLGAVLATDRAPQWLLAAVLVVVSLAWDQLFLVVDLLPATVPPAIVLLGWEAWRLRPGTSRGSGSRPRGRPRRRAGRRGAGRAPAAG